MNSMKEAIDAVVKELGSLTDAELRALLDEHRDGPIGRAIRDWHAICDEIGEPDDRTQN